MSAFALTLPQGEVAVPCPQVSSGERDSGVAALAWGWRMDNSLFRTQPHSFLLRCLPVPPGPPWDTIFPSHRHGLRVGT